MYDSVGINKVSKSPLQVNLSTLQQEQYLYGLILNDKIDDALDCIFEACNKQDIKFPILHNSETKSTGYFCNYTNYNDSYDSSMIYFAYLCYLREMGTPDSETPKASSSQRQKFFNFTEWLSSKFGNNKSFNVDLVSFDKFQQIKVVNNTIQLFYGKVIRYQISYSKLMARLAWFQVVNSRIPEKINIHKIYSNPDRKCDSLVNLWLGYYSQAFNSPNNISRQKLVRQIYSNLELSNLTIDMAILDKFTSLKRSDYGRLGLNFHDACFVSNQDIESVLLDYIVKLSALDEKYINVYIKVIGKLKVDPYFISHSMAIIISKQNYFIKIRAYDPNKPPHWSVRLKIEDLNMANNASLKLALRELIDKLQIGKQQEQSSCKIEDLFLCAFTNDVLPSSLSFQQTMDKNINTRFIQNTLYLYSEMLTLPNWLTDKQHIDIFEGALYNNYKVTIMTYVEGKFLSRGQIQKSIKKVAQENHSFINLDIVEFLVNEHKYFCPKQVVTGKSAYWKQEFYHLFILNRGVTDG